VRGRESSELQGEKPAVLGCPPSESREQTSRNTEGENVSVS
jgi:hypothetical protein